MLVLATRQSHCCRHTLYEKVEVGGVVLTQICRAPNIVRHGYNRERCSELLDSEMLD